MTVPLCNFCFKELSDLSNKEDRIDYFCDFCNATIKESASIKNISEELMRIKEQIKIVIDFVSYNNCMSFHPIAKDLLRRFL